MANCSDLFYPYYYHIIIIIIIIEWASARVPPTPLLGGWAGGASTVDVHPH